MYNPLAILLAAVRALVILIIMMLFLLIYLPLNAIFKISNKERNFWLRRFYANIANAILGIRCEIEGTPYDKPALYVSNHRSLSDPLIIAPHVNAFIIAKAEVSKIPVLDAGAQLTGIIYVKRDSKDSRSAVRKKLIDTILEGTNVLVYPEGTVNADQKLLEYKPGTFIEACKNNIPIVPIVLEYYHQKDHWNNRSMVSHFFLQFGKLFTKSKLSIGPAFSGDDGIKVRDDVMLWSQNKVSEMHKDWNSYFNKIESKKNVT